jgi:hypothetical protein
VVTEVVIVLLALDVADVEAVDETVLVCVPDLVVETLDVAEDVPVLVAVLDCVVDTEVVTELLAEEVAVADTEDVALELSVLV